MIKIITKVVIILLIISIFQNSNYIPPIKAENLTYQDILNSLNAEYCHLNSTIYCDKSRNFILFYSDNKLQIYKNGEIKKIFDTNSFCNTVFSTAEVSYYNNIQVSPDKNILIFYDDNGKSYSFSIKSELLEIFSYHFLKAVWNKNGNDFDFFYEQVINHYSMDQANLDQIGLYLKDNSGKIKQVISNSKSVNLIARKSDGIYFTLKNYSLNIDLFQNELTEEIVFDIKTGKYRFIPYYPDNSKVVIHKNTNDYSNYSTINNILYDYHNNILFYGNYFLVPKDDNSYIRYNKITGSKKIIPYPIAIYSGYIYYFSNSNYETADIYKMNITSLKSSKTSVCNVLNKYNIFIKNILYLSSNFKYYSYNLINNKLNKDASYPGLNEYHVFILKNKNRLCILESINPTKHIESANGKIIFKWDNGIYSDGYFYTIDTSNENQSMINKLDENGKIIKTIFKSNKILSLNIYGSYLYFSTGDNLYLYNTKTGKCSKCF